LTGKLLKQKKVDLDLYNFNDYEIHSKYRKGRVILKSKEVITEYNDE
jgi:hypothetical protein